MYLCQCEADMKLDTIARKFGLQHYASASASIRQFTLRLAHDQQLQQILSLIKLDLTP